MHVYKKPYEKKILGGRGEICKNTCLNLSAFAKTFAGRMGHAILICSKKSIIVTKIENDTVWVVSMIEPIPYKKLLNLITN